MSAGAVAPRQQQITPEQRQAMAELDKSIVFGAQGVELTNLQQAARFGAYAIESGLFRAKNPADVVMVLQTGMELGLSPVQSLQAFDLIDGKLAMKVDAQAAVVEAKGGLEPATKVYYRYDGEGEDLSCTAWSTPRGGKVTESETIYLRDFKHLRGKDNWKNYPKRMMKARAVGWHIRDYYSGYVRGLITTEEAADLASERGTPPVERDVTPPKGPDPLLADAGPSALARAANEPEDAEIVPPACTHPDGFAHLADAKEGDPRVCVHCNQSEDDEPDPGQLSLT